MSGLELTTQIKESHSKVSFLLASGYSSKQSIIINKRKFPIPRKPYKLESLVARISQLVSAPHPRNRMRSRLEAIGSHRFWKQPKF